MAKDLRERVKKKKKEERIKEKNSIWAPLSPQVGCLRARVQSDLCARERNR